MAISGKRHDYLRQDTNVPIRDLYKAGNLGTLNTAVQDILGVLDQLQGFIGNNNPAAIRKLLGDLGETLSTERLTQDFFTGVKNVTGLDPKSLEQTFQSAVTSVGSVVSNVGSTVASLRQLEGTVQQSVLGALSDPLGLVDTVTYGGVTQLVSGAESGLNSFVGLMGKLTGGDYLSEVSHKSGLANLITGVCGKGYDYGFPGVFTSLAKTVSDPQVLLSAGNSLLHRLSNLGQTRGIMDILNSGIGPNLRALNPGITQTVLKGFSLPKDLHAQDLPDFYAKFTEALSRLDPQWNKSADGTLFSCRRLSSNPELLEAMGQARRRATPAYTDFTAVPPVAFESLAKTLVTQPTPRDRFPGLPEVYRESPRDSDFRLVKVGQPIPGLETLF
jgi:hypothetical protein